METGIYIRVSTNEQAQEGFSIRAQEQKLTDFARIKDWNVYKVYMDEGISGKNLVDRPAMQELISDVKNNFVRNILVFKIDRLTRSTADLLYLVDLFNQYNCAFNSLTESIDTQTASGRMFLKIIGIFAEFERENIIERTKSGIERKLREGYAIGASPSFGYIRLKGQKIQTINEQEAVVVRQIFDMYVNEGLSIPNIARQLNLLNIRTKQQKTWSSMGIKRILTNCNYIGNVRHHTHSKDKTYSVEGLHKAIVPFDLFDTAQNLITRSRNVSPRKKPRPENYFSGLLTCANCGSKMKTHNSYRTLKDGTSSVHGHYICPNKRMQSCNAVGMSHIKVEQAFIEYISLINDLDQAENLQFKRYITSEKQSLIKAYTEKLRQFDTKEYDALTRYANDEMDFDQYRAVKEILDKGKNCVDSKLAQLQLIEPPSLEPADIVRNFRVNWENLSNEQRRQFLVQFVDRIIVTKILKKGNLLGTVKIIDIIFKKS